MLSPSLINLHVFFRIFSHENYILCWNWQIMSPESKRVHPTRAKIEALKSYKSEYAICTIKRDHSLCIEQVHPKSNNLYEIHFDLKNRVVIFPNFEDLEFWVEKLFVLISCIFEIFQRFKVQHTSTFIKLFSALIRGARRRVHMHKIHYFQQIMHKNYRINFVTFFSW